MLVESGEGEPDQHLLLELVGINRTCGRARALGSFYRDQMSVTQQLLEMRSHKGECPFVPRLFLDPNYFAGAGVPAQFFFELVLGKWVQLSEADNGRLIILAAVAFRLELVGDLSGTNQDSIRVIDTIVRKNGFKTAA